MIDGIPTVEDYRHWNEEAETMWWLENRYDMEHPEEQRADWEDDDDGGRYDEPDPFQTELPTEAEAWAFHRALPDTPTYEPMSWRDRKTGETFWYVEHYNREAHEDPKGFMRRHEGVE